MDAIKTNLKTVRGETIYDLSPESSELIACAGPDGHDPQAISDAVDWWGSWELPQGFRWISAAEWSEAVGGDPLTFDEIRKSITADVSPDGKSAILRPKREGE